MYQVVAALTSDTKMQHCKRPAEACVQQSSTQQDEAGFASYCLEEQCCTQATGSCLLFLAYPYLLAQAFHTLARGGQIKAGHPYDRPNMWHAAVVGVSSHEVVCRQ